MASMAVSLFHYFHQTMSVLIMDKMLRQIFNQFHTYLPPTSVPGSIPRLWRPQRHMGVDFVVSSFYSERLYILESNYHCYYMCFFYVMTVTLDLETRFLALVRFFVLFNFFTFIINLV